MDAVDRFEELVTGPADALAGSLDEAALLIAAHTRDDEQLEIASYLRRLDDLAERCEDASAPSVLDQLFVVEGFRGDAGWASRSPCRWW